MNKEKHDAYAVLRQSHYRKMLTIHMSQVCATNIFTITVGWLIYQKTHSAAMLGLNGLAVFLPHLLLALPVGHWVDHRSLKLLSTIGFVFKCLAGLGIAMCVWLSFDVQWMFPWIIAGGIGNVFLSVCTPVILRESIDNAHVENNANWSSLTRRIAIIVGSIVGGVLLASEWGALSALLLSVLLQSFNVFLTSIARMPRRQKASGAVRSWHELTRGIRYFARSPVVRSAMILDLVASFFGGCAGLLPLFAEDILHVGADGLGWLRAAPAIGASLATFVMTHRPPVRSAGMTMFSVVGLYGLMIIIFGLSHSFFISVGALMLMGAFDAISITIRSAIIQAMVPATIRGRMYGLNVLFINTSNELGDFESGMVSAFIGGPLTVVLGGIATVAVTGVAAWRFHELRGVRSVLALNAQSTK